jgi:hypothetical protein
MENKENWQDFKSRKDGTTNLLYPIYQFTLE